MVSRTDCAPSFRQPGVLRMIPIIPLLSQYKNVAIAISILGALCVSHLKTYTIGKERERAVWVAAENKRLTDTAMLILSNQKANVAKERKVSNAHQIELSAIRTRYESTNKRLRYTNTTKCDPAGTSDSTAGTDAAVARIELLPESIAENLRRLASDADEVTAIARGLQEFSK